MGININDGLFIIAQDVSGDPYYIHYHYIARFLDDYNNNAEMQRKIHLDGKVYYAAFNGRVFNSNDYTDFKALIRILNRIS